MKKVILFLSLLITTAMTNAQTIHWLTFVDTEDVYVGQIDVLGRKVLYGRYINLINAALASKGYVVNIQDYYGSRLSPENCKNVIQNLRCQPNDIIMFYYIGHGGRVINDKSTVYPQMHLGQFEDRMFVPLDWVYNQLKSKGARLSIVIGMCCNNESPSTMPKKSLGFSPNYGNTYMTDEEAARIQELCLNYEGSVLVTSASPGQTSICTSSNLGIVDSYTTSLVYNFEELQKGVIEPSWDKLLTCVRADVNEATGCKQTPIFETHLTKTSLPQIGNIEKTIREERSLNVSSNNQVTQDILNKIGAAYDCLVNTSFDEEKRIELEQEITQTYSQYFKEVKVQSQDNDIILDKSSFEDFNGRVATSRILRKIAVCGTSKSTNGKLALLVKEIYKK